MITQNQGVATAITMRVARTRAYNLVYYTILYDTIPYYIILYYYIPYYNIYARQRLQVHVQHGLQDLVDRVDVLREAVEHLVLFVIL